MIDIFSPSFGVFFWQLVSFLLLLFLSKKFFLKKIIDTLQQRAEYIDSNIKEAEKAQNLKEKLYEENEKVTREINKRKNDIKEYISSLKKEWEKKVEQEMSMRLAQGIKQVENEISQYKQNFILSNKKEIVNVMIGIFENLFTNTNVFTEENKSIMTRQMIDELVNKKYMHNNNSNH